MIRKMLAATAAVIAISCAGIASAGSIDVCTGSGTGPNNTGGVSVSEGGATITWGGEAGGPGGANQCLHIEHP